MEKSTKILIAGMIAAILTVSISLFIGFKENSILSGSILSSHSTCRTSTATSSLSVIASSTAPEIVLSCDAYHLDTSIYEATPMESAVLAVQFTAASSTVSTLTATISYSNDGVDWYKNYLVGDAIATTTYTISNSATTVTNYLFNVLTPTRYIKVNFDNPTAATSSVWAEFIPKKEINK